MEQEFRDTFLVEIRLARTKWRIRELTRAIAEAYPFGEREERHPHLTLFGPFTLRPGTSESDILHYIGTVAGQYGPLSFMIDGFELRQGMHGSVIAFPVRASKELRILSADIARELLPVTDSLNAWDPCPDEKWFHVTIANRLDPVAAAGIFNRMTGTHPVKAERPVSAEGFFWIIRKMLGAVKPVHKDPTFLPPLLDETGLRITVMHGEEILAEFDLLEKCWVHTGLDHESISWQRTMKEFRQNAGFECRDPLPTSAPKIFVISDLHLGHANIIRYCSRPFLFSDPDEMDHVLLKNWNYTVSARDKIYHLGDIRYGKGAPPLQTYRGRFHGAVTFISGNHDEPDLENVRSVYLSHDGIDFLLIHDPDMVPPGFSGWVIHGHHHNNTLRRYPFIDFLHRKINVSCEVTGYMPVSLDEIVTRIRERELSGNNAPILLRYPHDS